LIKLCTFDFADFDMCGIWCIFGSSVDTHQQIPSCFNIAHRGPDCFRFENVNHFSKCVFGFHRLAIVDDIYGMQPMRLHALPHIWMVSVLKAYLILLNFILIRLITVKFTISDR
jgi:asparagine synthetase B (glutamine-hydrolysing)